MRRHPAFDRITFDETPIRAAANTPENERKMTVKTQKRVLIYGICYFLVFILLSAIAPIARDGLTRENTTAEGKKEPEQKTDRPEQPAEDKPTVVVSDRRRDCRHYRGFRQLRITHHSRKNRRVRCFRH